LEFAKKQKEEAKKRK